MDHTVVWIEIGGKNKNSSLLLGTIYRSTRILDTQQWFLEMENMLSELTTSNDHDAPYAWIDIRVMRFAPS